MDRGCCCVVMMDGMAPRLSLMSGVCVVREKGVVVEG